jgi:hypothetical protein
MSNSAVTRGERTGEWEVRRFIVGVTEKSLK